MRENNARLSDEVGNLLQVRAEKERRALEIAEPPVREIKRDNRHIPGLKSSLPLNKCLNNFLSLFFQVLPLHSRQILKS